jgi:hypothetical protein
MHAANLLYESFLPSSSHLEFLVRIEAVTPIYQFIMCPTGLAARPDAQNRVVCRITIKPALLLVASSYLLSGVKRYAGRLGYGRKAVYICKAPSTHCTSPNTKVKTSTKIATQKVYHCTSFRRLHHHCDKVLGSTSSKTCLSTTRRSRQKAKLSICLSIALSLSHFTA